MGKANKQRQAQAKKTRTDKVVAAVCIVFAVLIVGTLIFTAVNESGIFLRTNDVIYNSEVEVNAAMMSFFLNNNIVNWYNNYGYYASMLGLNLAADLKTQTVSSTALYYSSMLDMTVPAGITTGSTWYEFFMASTLEEVKLYVACARAAAEDNIALSEEELDAIDADIKNLKESFRTSGLSFSDWFGRGVNESDVRKCYNLMYLRDKYVEFKYDEIEKAIEAETDLASVKEYIEEHKSSFYSADVLVHTIKISSKGLTDKEYNEKVAAAKEAAKKITAEGNSVEAYIAAIEAYEASVKSAEKEEAKTETETETETETGTETEVESKTEKETTEKSLEDKIEDIKENVAYATDTDTEYELEDWLFEESAEEGDMNYFEETGTETEKETTTSKPSSGSKSGEEVEETTSDKEEETTSKKEENKKKSYKVYTVNTYYVYRACDLDRELTHNFAYLVSDDKEVVFDFIKQFNSSDKKTLDSFCDLAKKINEDIHADENHTHSNDEFFEYNKLEKQPAGAFGTNYSKLNDWIEDDARKAGEVSERIEITIVSGSSSATSKPTINTQYAAIYFEKHNVPTWQAYGQSGAVNEDFEEWFEEECKSITVKEKDVNNTETTIQTIVSLYSGY